MSEQALERQTATIASLRTVTRHNGNDTIFVPAVDKVFRFVAGSVTADDGSTWIAPSDATVEPLGRWKAILGGVGGGGGPGSDTTAIHKGGDTYGSDIVIGPIDAHNLVFQVGDTTAWLIDHATSALLPGGDGSINIGVDTTRVDRIFAYGGELTDDLTLDEMASDPAVAAGKVKLYSKSVAGAAELFCIAGDGTVFQLTSNSPLDATDVNAWHKTGDSFGADEILGTLDAHSLYLYARGHQVVAIDDGTAAENLKVDGLAGHYASMRLDSHGGAGAGYAAYLSLYNTDGGFAQINMGDSDSSHTPAYNQFENYLTISTSLGYGIRCNVNAANNTGYTIATDGSFRFLGAGLAFFSGNAIAKPTVTGSKGGNAALTSLMAALGASGFNLVNDTTT